MVTAQEAKNALQEKIASLEGERRTAFRVMQEAMKAITEEVQKKGKDTDSEVEIVEEKGGGKKRKKGEGKRVGKQPPAKKAKVTHVSNGSLMKELKKNEVSIFLSLPPPHPLTYTY